MKGVVGRVKGGFKYCWLHETKREFERCFCCVINLFAKLTGNQFGTKRDPHHYQYDPENLIDFC